MRKALVYLDGGDADGLTLELDEPHWAPLATLRVAVDGIQVVYVLARQRDPQPGRAWRYIPESAYDDGEVLPPNRDGNYDPFDD